MIRPRTAYRLTLVICTGVVFGCLFRSVAAQAPGDGQMFLDNPTWAIGDADRDLFVRASYAEFEVLGYSVGLAYDESRLAVKSATWDGALPFEPEFFRGSAGGGLIGYGCVFDFSFNNVLAPSANQPLIRIVFDVAATQPGSTDIIHTEVPTNPQRPVSSVLTDGGGQTRHPELLPGTVTIVSLAPVITGFQANSGRPGSVFSILGENFDQPNLAVAVCGRVAAAELQPDNSLLVTAPECAAVGPVEVSVCTSRGCDIDPTGFSYDPPVPIITGFQNNQGLSGDDFIIEGENFGEPDLSVTVCSNSAVFDLLVDGSLLVTAPDCELTGPATVVVCNVHGCDSVQGGFTYEIPEGPVIASLEGNSGRPGKVFTVRGENFGAPGLEVTVCDTVALAALKDPETLLVTAPACEVVGEVELQICTIFSCASRADGFTYDPPSPGPEITGFEENVGSEGDRFRILGNNFTGATLAVRVCAVEAAFEIEKDGSLLVTTPPCGVLGSVEVEVCNESGCDSAPGGFTYVEPRTPFLRADANCDGGVDIADSLYTLNHLFLADSPEPCCDPAADSNGDVVIDVSDALYTLNFLFLGGFPPPPAPYPDCGAAAGIVDCGGHPCSA